MNCATGCTEEKRINRVEHAVEATQAMLQEMRTDLKEVKSVVQITGAMQIENTHMKESLTRAFARIEKLEAEKAHDQDVDEVIARVRALERSKETYDAFLNQVQGMKHLAWALWTILAGGLGLVIVKLFLLSSGAA
jgi:regulator of replication initiation timing